MKTGKVVVHAIYGKNGKKYMGGDKVDESMVANFNELVDRKYIKLDEAKPGKEEPKGKEGNKG